MNSPSLSNGFQTPNVNWGEYNKIVFAVTQALGKMQTNTLVKIVKCTNVGDLLPVGFVDVIPMVHQIDGDGNPTPHATIFNIPYLRIQGGANAIIIDPQEGDIGICCFASRDISKVKNTKKAGAPGSLRQFNFSDGMYLGGMLNGTPEQYIQFLSSGVKVVSPTKITCQAPVVEVLASTSATVTSPAIHLANTGQSLLALVTEAFEALYNAHTHNGGGTGTPVTPMSSAQLTTTVKGA